MKSKVMMTIVFLFFYSMASSIVVAQDYMTDSGEIREVNDGEAMTDSGEIEDVGDGEDYMTDTGEIEDLSNN